MKYATLAALGIAWTSLLSSPSTGQEPPKGGESDLKSAEDRGSYALGQNIGKSMKAQGVPINPDALARGLRDALAGKAALDDQQAAEAMQALQRVVAARQAGAGDQNLKDGQAFLAANKAKPGVKTTASGLQYKVIAPGKGKTPKATDSVVVNYRGTLIDGTEFDSGQGIDFPVNAVIRGWTEVLQLMKAGEKVQAFIPSDLAYGPRGAGAKIGPNSTLIFDIELVEVK